MSLNSGNYVTQLAEAAVPIPCCQPVAATIHGLGELQATKRSL